MSRGQKLRLFALIMIASVLSGSGLAAASCPPMVNGPRLDIQAPSGCRFQELFEMQVANPKDLRQPTDETMADAERRLKTLSNWRNENAKKASGSEKSN